MTEQRHEQGQVLADGTSEFCKQLSLAFPIANSVTGIGLAENLFGVPDTQDW